MAGLREQIRKLILRAQTDGIDKSKADISGLRSEVGHLKDAWKVLGEVAAAVGVTLTVAAAIKGIKDSTTAVINTGREIENYQTRLNAIIRDEERSAKLLQFIIHEAERTPFSVAGIGDAAAQLEILGVNAEALLPRLSDVAAASGQRIEDVAGKFSMALQGQTRGLVQLGITRAQIEKELGRPISEGEGFTNQKELLEALVRIMDRDYAGAIERTRDRFDVMVDDFGDNLDLLKRRIAGGGFFDTVKKDMRELLDLENRFVQAGGADAIALGFNNAFKLIHDTFFTPFFEDLDSLEVNTTVVAARVEQTILKLTKGVTDSVMHIAHAYSLLTFATATGPQEFVEGLMSGDFSRFNDQWDEMITGFDSGYQKSEKLTERLDQLNQAIVLLGQTGGKVTPEIEKLLGYGDKLSKVKVPEVKPPAPPLTTGRGGLDGAGEAPERPHTLQPLRPELFSLPRSVFDQAAKQGEHWGAELGKGMRLGVDAAHPGIGIDQQALASQIAGAQTQWSGYSSFLGELETSMAVDHGDRDKQFQDDLAVLLGDDTSKWTDYYAELSDLSSMSAEERMHFEQQVHDNAMALQDFALERTRAVYERMGAYSNLFVQRGINVGRVLNAFLVRSGAETAKALIDYKLREAKVEAEIAAARALIAIGSGNIAGGLKMLAGAAKLFALVGAGSLAKAFIDSRAAMAEENILGPEGGFPGTPDDPAGPAGRTKAKGNGRGTASSVRVGPQVNYNYVSIYKTAGRDIIEGDTGLTDAQELQRLFDEGIIQIPQR